MADIFTDPAGVLAANNLEFALQQERKKAEIERLKAEEFQRQLNAGPKLQYNPIEETVGPDGKKTIGLRKEFQIEGPEKYIQAERERLQQQQMLGKSDLAQQLMQQQAQQQGRLAQYGLKGGNRALMDRYSMRDALMAQQGLGRQFQQQAGELEQKGMLAGMETQQKRVGLLGQAVKDIEQFNLDKWKQQKAVEAAQTQAQATRDASKPDK